ncbi:MAG: glutamate ABC transporter substrate-binding protein [Chloroflexi bacterium]|nr:MAG: glutamate ABC transporter substrate-binding protein [Chloroflexota bacterium]
MTPAGGRWAIAGAAALTLAVAACGTPALLVRPAIDGAAPSPSPSTPAAAAPDTSCGDPTASLRPQGPPPAPGALPAGSFMQAIYQRGRLVAGVSRDTLLFGSVNPTTDRIEGFDIDILRQVAKALFGDPDRIEFRVITPAQRIPALQAGTVDIVGRTFTVNCVRWRQIDFSSVYYVSGQRVLVPRGSPISGPGDLGGKRICVPAGTTALDGLSSRASRKPIPVVVADQTDCLVLLELGTVDAAVNDESVLLGLAVQDPSMVVVGPRFTVEPYGLGIAQSHPDFVRFVNAVLEQMRSDGAWSAIYNHWLSRIGPDAGPPPARYRD